MKKIEEEIKDLEYRLFTETSYTIREKIKQQLHDLECIRFERFDINGGEV